MPNRQEVRAALNAMQWWNYGGTQGNLGMVWGWRTLSPRWRGLWGGLTPNNRPLDYHQPGAQKIVVMLTDGDNLVHTTLPTSPAARISRLTAGSRTPPSPGPAAT